MVIRHDISVHIIHENCQLRQGAQVSTVNSPQQSKYSIYIIRSGYQR